MILAVLKDQPVGIVHPIDFGAEVKLRPKWLVHVVSTSAIDSKSMIEVESSRWRIRLDDVIDTDMAPAPGGLVEDSHSGFLPF